MTFLIIDIISLTFDCICLIVVSELDKKIYQKQLRKIFCILYYLV